MRPLSGWWRNAGTGGIGPEGGVVLLDTTVLVDLGRRPASESHRRAAWYVAELLNDGESLVTSRINDAELRVGPELADDRERELVRVERILAGLTILEFDAAAARQFAAIKAILLRRGKVAGDCDMLIAAVAVANGQVLVTRNPKHFVDIPGLVVNSY